MTLKQFSRIKRLSTMSCILPQFFSITLAGKRIYRFHKHKAIYNSRTFQGLPNDSYSFQELNNFENTNYTS